MPSQPKSDPATLSEFVERFGALGDEAFLANFSQPFLVEMGGDGERERALHMLRTPAGQTLTIGSKPDAGVVLDAASISPQHAVLIPGTEEGEAWSLMDVGSEKGTFVAGERLEQGKPVELGEREPVRFGAAGFVFLSASNFLRLLRRLGEDQSAKLEESDEGAPIEVPEPRQDPEPEPEDALDDSELGPAPSFGGPADASDEHPMLLVGPEASAEEGEVSELQQAYECLEIRTPVQEYETYARARLETLIRMGETEQAEITEAALKLGLDALRGAMGALPAVEEAS